MFKNSLKSFIETNKITEDSTKGYKYSFIYKKQPDIEDIVDFIDNLEVDINDIKDLGKNIIYIVTKFKLKNDIINKIEKEFSLKFKDNNFSEVIESEVDESAVGQRGRTDKMNAEKYIKENPELVVELRKIVKKMGGKNVAMEILSYYSKDMSKDILHKQNKDSVGIKEVPVE